MSEYVRIYQNISECEALVYCRTAIGQMNSWKWTPAGCGRGEGEWRGLLVGGWGSQRAAYERRVHASGRDAVN